MALVDLVNFKVPTLVDIGTDVWVNSWKDVWVVIKDIWVVCKVELSKIVFVMVGVDSWMPFVDEYRSSIKYVLTKLAMGVLKVADFASIVAIAVLVVAMIVVGSMLATVAVVLNDGIDKLVTAWQLMVVFVYWFVFVHMGYWLTLLSNGVLDKSQLDKTYLELWNWKWVYLIN